MVRLTPLTTVPAFSADLLKTLDDYWITSVEEFVSTARAGNQQFVNGLAALGQALGLPEPALLGLYAAAQDALPAGTSFDILPELAVGLGAIFDGMHVPDLAAFDLP